MNPAAPGSPRAGLVLAAVRQLPGLDGASSPARVPGGRSHECWRLQSPAGPILAKVPARDPSPVRAARHAAMHEAARASGAPVARLITAGHSPVLDAPLLVLEWTDGTDAEAAWPGLDDAARTAVCRDWGAVVARLHALRPPDGHFTGHPAASWPEVASARTAELARRHAAARLLPGTLITAAATSIEREAALLGSLVQPRLAHLDLHLPNILARDGRLAALLDFEHARWWDPAADLVKLGMWVFGPHPQARAPFWAGYAAAGGRLPAAAARARVCAGLEWLSGILYWHRVGDHRMYHDYQQRLHAWLAQAPPSRHE